MTSEEEVEMGTYASSRSGVRSTLIAVAVAAVAFAAAAVPASAYEFTPTWGYAQIDDAPFHEPAGALLPVSQAFPRGRIKDAGSPDGWKVKITVFAFNASGQNLYSYSLTEGAAVYTAFDRRIDVNPNQISYLRLDFCRADGLCEPSLRTRAPLWPSRSGWATRRLMRRCGSARRGRASPMARHGRSDLDPPGSRSLRNRAGSHPADGVRSTTAR
jgi:hypothetical protein